MVEQRCREPRRHRAGRPRGRGRLELLGAVALLTLTACSGDPLEPRPDQPGGNHPGTSGGNPAASLVGAWKTVVVIQVPGDLQTWTTTWRFESDGTCRQTVVSESLAEGFPRTTERTCTYTISGSSIIIAYIGGGELTFEFSFAGFSPDRLILDGFEYERIT
jgi:hypothetical protein